jgi:hypothetical protein
LQPQAPLGSHAEPAVLFAQFAQAPPLVPQAFGAAPPTHVVPLQQPPLHGVSLAAPHAVEQVCVCALHALPAGQSVAAPQPQVSVPGSQTWPAPLVLQLAQTAPLPQAPAAVPAAHWPATGSQQPPLHAVWFAAPHALAQVCVVVLHAVPLGQSEAALHPHMSVLAMQALPAALPVQSTHAFEPPQAVALVPGRHELPEPQQPELQGEAGSEHVKVHRPVVVLHPALLDGQSELLAQPHWPPPVTGSHTPPDVPPLKPAVHEAQMPPLLPHAVVPVPGWQVPPVAAEQQPPLHGCEVPQLVVHVCVVTSQA